MCNVLLNNVGYYWTVYMQENQFVSKTLNFQLTVTQYLNSY